MDLPNISPLIDRVDQSIDELEAALEPLFAALSRTDTIPPLDQAKVYTWAAFSIDSILYSLLNLNDVNARQHRVYGELTRVRQYFEKIQIAETANESRTTKLDTGAAIRFIKADLGDDVTIRSRLEQQLLHEKHKAAAAAVAAEQRDKRARQDSAGQLLMMSSIGGSQKPVRKKPKTGHQGKSQ